MLDLPSVARNLVLAGTLVGGVAAQLNPPTILWGAGPRGDVHSMTNNQNALATMGNGDVAAVVYRQTSDTAGGHLTLAVSVDGEIWRDYYPLPNNTGHRVHEWNSGLACNARDCDLVHVAWADRSAGGAYSSVYLRAFDSRRRVWTGSTTLVAAADIGKRQGIFTRDIAVTPSGTVVLAVGVGANGGLGMGPWECALMIKKRGAAAFSGPFPMRNGGQGWSREASISVIEEVVHCAFKTLEGAGGMAYRSFDSVSSTWQQPAQVLIGPNSNGRAGVDGINAGNKGVLAIDTKGGLYILYVTGSQGGLASNNKMRMAYARPGTGSQNADWRDLEILAHNPTVGTNHRGVSNTDPAYPMLRGGDSDSYSYTLVRSYQGAMLVLYAKPWETFQNKYLQIYQEGVNVPLPTKEIPFWNDTQPYMFERLSGLRNSSAILQGAWTVYGKNDSPQPGQAPNGRVRLWAASYSIGRTVSYGVGCRGSNNLVPRMQATEQFPQIGATYPLEIDRLPLFGSFSVMLGFNCQKLDLNFMGAPGCIAVTDFPVLVPMTADANGEKRLVWNIPNDINLIGQGLNAQSFVIDGQANNAGATVSNALRLEISL